MPSSIKITVNSTPRNNIDTIFFAVNTVYGFMNLNFKTSRIQPYDVEISNSNFLQVSLIAEAFNTDFNQFKEFSFKYPLSNQLIITKKTGENFFDSAVITGNWGVITTSSSPDPVIPELTEVIFSDKDCLNVTTSLTFNDVLSSLIISKDSFANVSSPINVSLSRGLSFVYKATIGQETITGSIETPALWNLTNIKQTPTNNGFVVEIVVSESGNNRNVFEYSLDGIAYKATSVFPGILSGTYTAYVRDSYGCNQQTQFTVQSDPFSTVSDLIVDFPLLNSFHFIKSEEVNGCNTYQSELNTASYLQDGNVGRRFYHLVQTCDCIRTQFKSSYDIHQAKIYGCNGLEIEIPIEKKSNNINQYDVRDNVISSIDNKLVFYINGGDIYEPTSLTVIGQNTIVNDIFQYNTIGTVVQIQDIGFVSIKNISFIDSLDAWVAVTDIPYVGETELKRVTSNYNVKDYEIYEFEYDFNGLGGVYFIGVRGLKGTNSFEYVTEYINVKELHENADEIIHRHTTNKEIDYRTGIVHYMRIPRIIRDVYSSVDENDIYAKDTDVVSIDSDLFRSKVFGWGLIPTAMARKIDEALANDTLYINRQKYVKATTPEITPLGQGSNLYRINSELRIAEGNLSGLNKRELVLQVLKFSNAETFFTDNVNGIGYISLGISGYISIGQGNILLS